MQLIWKKLKNSIFFSNFNLIFINNIIGSEASK